jgi:hypothetical protein
MTDQLETFAAEARIFCNWATGADGTPMTVASAVRRVSSVYAAALNLPPPFTESTSTASREFELPSDAVQPVAIRAAELPLQVYWEIYDPLEEPRGEPVIGSVADDIGDIYLDVARGLLAFDSGDRDEALWEWGFGFQSHWGRHAVDVIRALHWYLSSEQPDGLSKNA